MTAKRKMHRASNRLLANLAAIALVGALAAAGLRAQGHSAAVELFSQARAGIAQVPAVSQPEYFLYLANQEARAGQGAAALGDFERAFRLAVALAAGGFATLIKREVEPSAVEALSESGDFGDAASLAPHADAGRAEIVDTLIGHLLADRKRDDAWRWWGELGAGATPFPFEAAARLLTAGGSPSQIAAVQTTGERAAGEAASMAEAEAAMDFLEADASWPGAAGAARALVGRLEALDAAGWEAEAVYRRARAVVQKGDPQHPLAQAPLQFRPHAVERAARERTPASDLAPFTAVQAEQMEREFSGALNETAIAAQGRGTAQEIEPRPDPEKYVTPALAAQAPSFTARWAHSYYCAGHADNARPLLVLALDAMDAQVARPRPPEVMDFDGAPFWVYGLAAQMDFALAREHAEELPEGWFKPLALAHVARMESAARANRPGHCAAVVY